MKREFLEGLGLEKEVIDNIMAENGKDIEKHKKLAETAEADKQAALTQVQEISGKLEKMGGEDVEGLKKQIETLQADIKNKEIEFTTQLANRDFDALLNTELLTAKAKNPKAVTALLDIDGLRNSKNQKEDMAAAIKALAETDTYLFGEETTPATKVSTGGEHKESDHENGEPETLVDALKEHYKKQGE